MNEKNNILRKTISDLNKIDDTPYLEVRIDKLVDINIVFVIIIIVCRFKLRKWNWEITVSYYVWNI